MIKVNIYFNDCYKSHESKKLLLRALNSYCIEKNLDIDISRVQIEKGDKGKPYFLNLDLEFNISHSGEFWACAISKYPVGIDIHTANKDTSEKISERYYSQEEHNFVELWGKEGFFSIWVRKEAYAKLYGNSIFETINKVNMVKDGELILKIGDDKLTEIEIADDIKCAVASKEDDICIRMIG